MTVTTDTSLAGLVVPVVLALLYFHRDANTGGIRRSGDVAHERVTGMISRVHLPYPRRRSG
ncbi:MAG TPA: hypothetical protein VHV74_08330 [Pseudonocardiaceae bacterium]|nr:hypothetical protein [Pseudonocardiaceae bacterium]